MPKVNQTGLADQLAKRGVKKQVSREPLWKGPEKEGITFSLLSRYLVCRERFRLMTMEGLRTRDTFNHRLEYGTMWHICEEAAAKEHKHFRGDLSGVDTTLWEDNLRDYARGLCLRYPTQQGEIDKWYEVCKRQFPIYVKFWSKHPDTRNRQPLLSERAFCMRYRLPSGRAVLLRGKWDSVDTVAQEIWLQENKSKGDINQEQIQRQLTFDLQTMLYLAALDKWKDVERGYDGVKEQWRFPIAGVRYNVIRRPLSGGKGTIVRGKGTQGSKCPKCKGSKQQYGRFICPKCKGHGRIGAKPEETFESYYDRVTEYIKTNPQDYFMRWNVYVNAADIIKFQRECLDPVLDNLCDDYEWWQWCSQIKGGDDGSSVWEYTHRARQFKHHQSRHYRMPYGVYNPLLEGNQTELDHYLATGREDGLERVTDLFPELK